jgi:mRNA-degrading endonuclease RelE of RelBE toxin-antitoxin system
VIFERTTRFKRAAKKLPTQDRDRLAKALVLYEANPSHPSLGTKRVQGTKGIWEARVSDAVRFTFEKIDGGILLRNVGAHDPTLRRP